LRDLKNKKFFFEILKLIKIKKNFGMTRPHSGCPFPLCGRKGEPSRTPKRGNGHDPIPDHAGSAHFWEKPA